MTEETRNLQIEVRAGDANQPAVGLTANEPVEPFSVGSAASWQVYADGIAEVHAYLFFDGVTLFVSSVDPQNPAYANGQPVGSTWVPLGPGSEVTLGAATLGVTGDAVEEMDVEPDPEPTGWGKPRRPELPKPSPPSADEATVLRPVQSDDLPPPAPPRAGGEKSKRKKVKIRQSARENQPPDDEATRFAPLDASGPPAPLPAAGQPAPRHIGGEGALPPAASTPAPPGGPAHAPAPWTPPGVTASAPPGGVPSGPPPAPPGGQGAFAPPGIGAPVPAGAPPMPGGPPAPAGPPMPGGAPLPGGPPMPGTAPVPGMPSSPAASMTTTQPPSDKAAPLHAVVAQWKNASLPQKAILVLMPFAFVAMFIVFDDGGDEGTSPAKPVASVSASASASAPRAAKSVESTTTAAAVTPAGDASPDEEAEAATQDEPPKLAKGEKTKQRKAADAIAAGNHAEALELYEELAKDHPDEPAYKATARILRARVKGK